MTITRQATAQRLIDYLQHRTTLSELVDWAENAMMDTELEPDNHELLRDVISRIGLSDVRSFGLTWEDCEDFLSRLGYEVQIQVGEAPAARR
jgi:hypothetical protein